jgi:multiple sugar transport system substrate-binding protein
MAQYKGADDELRYEGNYYALPYMMNIYCIFYNKTMFDKVGVPYPSDDMTWEEYADLCEKMTFGEGAEKVYGGFFNTTSTALTNMAICNGKNEFITDDYSYLKPYYELFLDMHKKGIVMDYSTIKTNSLVFTQCFYKQQIATFYQGTWSIGYIVQQAKTKGLDFEWGIAASPHSSDGGAPGDVIGQVHPICINSKSKLLDEAFDYLSFVCATEEGAQVVADTGCIPANNTEKTMQSLLKLETFPQDGIEPLISYKNLVMEVPKNKYSAKTRPMLDEVHSLIMTESISIDEGIAEINRRAKDILADK